MKLQVIRDEMYRKYFNWYKRQSIHYHYLNRLIHKNCADRFRNNWRMEI